MAAAPPPDRHAAVTEAAYALLQERGYAATSMLLIAKRARASNETLYKWYGDKPGLMRRMIADNAAHVRALLDSDSDGANNPPRILVETGRALLTLLLSERAIALNRAAAADVTGTLGQILTETGRDSVAPLIGRVLEAGRAAGNWSFTDTRAAVRLYLDLLVGDMQIRRAIGALPQPDADAIAARADAALDQFTTLTAAGWPRIGSG